MRHTSKGTRILNGKPPETIEFPEGSRRSKAEPLVYAVVLNYCCAAETIGCVRALQRLRDDRLRVLVVDNASPDDSEARLAEALPEVERLQAGRNLGYGDGNNCGIRRALAAGADFVWILTPDVRVEPASLDPLVRLMSDDPSVGICGPVIRAGDVCITSSHVTPRAGYAARHCHYPAADTPALPETIPSDYVDGCAILLRRSTIQQIGLFREDFFLYYDETEYCLRAKKYGWKVLVASQSRVRTRSMNEPRNNRDYYIIRNSLILARVRQQYVLRTVALHVARALLHVCRIRRRKTPHFASVTFRAVPAGLLAPLRSPPEIPAELRSSQSRGAA